MKYEFKNKHLIQLYTDGRSKKYRFLDKSSLRKFFKCILAIEAAVDIYDFYNSTSLHFEKLEGYDSKFSMRLNIKNRLMIEISFEDDEKTAGIVAVIDITKHYQ